MRRGGQNRSHASTEGVSRIDSFYWINRKYAQDYAAETGDPDAALPIDQHASVRVTWTSNTYDKPGQPSRMYWICPQCSRRARFLYYAGRGLICRRCARLNYPCQQQTRNTAAEVQNMRAALIEMGCYDLARASLNALLDADPPPMPEDWDSKSFSHGWRRFCKARNRYFEHLNRQMIMLAFPR